MLILAACLPDFAPDTWATCCDASSWPWTWVWRWLSPSLCSRPPPSPSWCPRWWLCRCRRATLSEIGFNFFAKKCQSLFWAFFVYSVDNVFIAQPFIGRYKSSVTWLGYFWKAFRDIYSHKVRPNIVQLYVLSKKPFFANTCAQSFYSSIPIGGEESVYIGLLGL